MKKLVSITELEVGMFVNQITKSKQNLVVKSQGMIRSQDTIVSLKNRGILEFQIDFDKSECSEQVLSKHLHTEKEITTATKPRISKAKTRNTSTLEIISFEQQQQDFAEADRFYSEAREIHQRFYKQLKGGNKPDFNALNTLSQDIIDSVFANPEALACLLMLKESNEYLIEHALNCAILLSLFAKYKGMSQTEVEDLTLAGLLMDCGMGLLPEDLILKKDSFSEADRVLMQTHVDIGYEIAERFSDMPPAVLDIIANHHERIDGSGYPKNKRANDISLYAKMAAIADNYDALLTDKLYRSSTRAHEALKLMQSDKGLDKELVDEFVSCIGLFPVGSLVHLKSEKLAIVVQKNPKYPLDPTVMTFYSIRTKCPVEIKRINLKTQNADKIIGSVTPEEFDVNLPHFFRTALLAF